MAATTSTLPLILSCNEDKKFSVIEVGGITLDSKPLAEDYQKMARDECNQQLSNPSGKVVGKSRTTCEIWFGQNLTMNETSTINAVYQCLMFKPNGTIGWSKPKYPKAEINTGNYISNNLLYIIRK